MGGQRIAQSSLPTKSAERIEELPVSILYESPTLPSTEVARILCSAIALPPAQTPTSHPLLDLYFIFPLAASSAAQSLAGRGWRWRTVASEQFVGSVPGKYEVQGLPEGQTSFSPFHDSPSNPLPLPPDLKVFFPPLDWVFRLAVATRSCCWRISASNCLLYHGYAVHTSSP